MLSDLKPPKNFVEKLYQQLHMFETETRQLQLQVMTPYEIWKGYKPNVKHLCIFNFSAYAHIPKDVRSKMDPKAKSIFLRYGIGVKGYRL